MPVLRLNVLAIRVSGAHVEWVDAQQGRRPTRVEELSLATISTRLERLKIG